VSGDLKLESRLLTPTSLLSKSSWRLRLKETLGVDLRSLALFRICLGSLILVDLVLRSVDLQAHYTDFGVLPRGVLWEMYSQWHISLHTASGS
jgi:hypothetical protein